MKDFLSDINHVVDVHFTNPALFWAGFTLSGAFALVGLVVSFEVWMPIAAIIVVAALIAIAGRKKMDALSPEREMLIRQTVSHIVSMSIRGRMPYKFDLPTKEILAKRLKISKSKGVEVVAVPLLIIEKGEIDLQLLDKVLSDHLEMAVDMSPGIGIKAYSDFYNALTLIELQKLDMEIVLHIVIADNWFANRYLDNWFMEQMQRRKGDKHYGE